MKAWLGARWALPAARVAVLHDRAPPAFRETPLEEAHALFLRLAPQLPPLDAFDMREAGAALAAGASAGSGADAGDGTAAEPAADAASAEPARRRRRGSAGAGAGASSGGGGASSSPRASPPSLRPAGNGAGAGASAAAQRTLFTERLADGRVARRADPPALSVSATIRTEDEDFGVLLDALVALDAAAGAHGSRLPRFVVVVTGKGPQRAHYEARMAALALRRVRVSTAWLEAADYPLLLGAADLGVCLHTSSSGLDLPMKVVDMFGAGLPVCAVGFRCLGELVRDGENGLVFADAAQLAAQVARLFDGFGAAGEAGAAGTAGAARRRAGANTSADAGANAAGAEAGEAPGAELARLRAGVRAFQRVRWHDNWLAHAAPIFCALDTDA
jgi:hypothetical protein